jgi:thiol-disulfide isomerase/thioredoxin
MLASKKAFLFGLGAGIAVTLVALQLWSNHLKRAITENAQPRILHPFGHAEQPSPNAFASFPRPWFPESLSSVDTGWKLTPIDGAPITLAQFKGKVLFLNFWSTRCSPCIAEMPGIARLYHSLHDERVAFAAVSDEARPKMSSFLRENNLQVPVYLAGQKPPENLSVGAIPTTFILDSSGIPVFMHRGPLNWDDDGARAYLLQLAERATPQPKGPVFLR